MRSDYEDWRRNHREELEWEDALFRDMDRGRKRVLAALHVMHAAAVERWGPAYAAEYLHSDMRTLLDEHFPEFRVPRTEKAPIPTGLRRRVFERDGYRCVTCNGWEKLSLDHIIPESKGGPTTFENLQTMCQSCNSRKGARDA